MVKITKTLIQKVSKKKIETEGSEVHQEKRKLKLEARQEKKMKPQARREKNWLLPSQVTWVTYWCFLDGHKYNTWVTTITIAIDIMIEVKTIIVYRLISVEVIKMKFFAPMPHWIANTTMQTLHMCLLTQQGNAPLGFKSVLAWVQQILKGDTGKALDWAHPSVLNNGACPPQVRQVPSYLHSWAEYSGHYISCLYSGTHPLD